jgi:hypothetical protein
VQSKPPSATPLAGGGFASLLSAAFLLTAIGCSAPPERADTTIALASAGAAACLGAGASGVIRVRADSVGAIASQLTIDELRLRCPEARDTVDPWDTGDRHPALQIPAPIGTTIFAVQYRDAYVDTAGRRQRRMVPSEPVTYWRLQGASIELPGGMRSSAPWANLVRQYGPTLVVSQQSHASATFCALRDFSFSFDTPWIDSGFVMLDTSSSRIPVDARASVITMIPRAPSPPAMECGGSSAYLAPGGAERNAIAISKGMVRRVGDTLFIRAANSTQSTLVTRPQDGDTRVVYTYAGTLANGTLHRIDVIGWEAAWTEYVSARTGQMFSTAGEPIISPDGKRLASSYYAMVVCEVVPRLEILRLTDSVPAPELAMEPRDCDADTGWAPRELKWLSPDTLAFMADSNRPADAPQTSPLDTSRYISRPMLAIRSGARWRIVPKP